MEFRNLTPFPALCFSALDVAETEHKVIVMKVAYRLRPLAHAGFYQAEVIDDEPPELTFEDTFWGEMNQSSESTESDLAPYKPKCDVLLHGSAHAPGGKPAQRVGVRLRILAGPADGRPASSPADIGA
uniref:DUF2169 domain-containing protein n=1 Tax=Chitinibacter sp. GC72 TaxID=1526917 RepID=UPI0012F9FC18